MNIYLIYIAVAIGLFVVTALITIVGVYAERKVSALIQDRLGPTEVGKWGTLQVFADFIKMLQKELIIPAAADKWLFMMAPAVIYVGVFMGFAALPWAPGLAPSNLNLGLYYIFAIISLETLGILMAGWGSNNKYAMLGAMRSVAQIISYEIPAGFALISVMMIAQTLNLQTIAAQQGVLSAEKVKALGFWDVTHIGGLFAWNVVRAPHLLLAFAIYFIASLAESNRAPFDIPEAESELVAGFHTEYTGLRFAFVFMAEYSMMFLVSMVSVIVFLGAWNTPLPNIGSLHLADWTTNTAWGIFWVVLKIILLVAVQIWIRWTLPRFRVDQLMNLCWKVLTPLAFLCMLLSGLWRVWAM